VGDLLARIEILKQRLAAEGLFDADRKRALPFIPRKVGLITGRAGAAEKDVVENARRHWPSVLFVVREVAVQGVNTVTEVTAALRELDADRSVDVIIIARGGGAAEELLPFSNETLLRAVADAVTPVISAIGHDIDSPLLDHVADWRASTPTDAGAQRSRPVMADPTALVSRHREQVTALRARARERLLHRLHRAHDQVGHLASQVRALSPQSTLERGYAVVQHPDGRVVMDQADLEPDGLLRVRVAHGDFGVRTVGRPDRQDARTGRAPG